VLRADPSGSDLIRLGRGEQIRMEGRETFRAGVNSMTEVTTEALAACDCRLQDIDLFVYHQANSRMLRSVAQRLGLASDRVVDYVERFANASTATLPIALTVAVSEGRIRPGDRVLLAAFGGGLTRGGTVVQWSASASRRSAAAASSAGARAIPALYQLGPSRPTATSRDVGRGGAQPSVIPTV
jgi:3-oxoacyl-[acyl-carrier-protein] synthase III